MTQRSLFFFLFLSYAISWALWLPLYGPVLGISAPVAMPGQHIWGAFGPLAAAVVTTLIFKPRSLKTLLYNALTAKNARLLLLAAFAPFALGLLSVAVAAAIHRQPVSLQSLIITGDFGTQNIVTFTLLNIATFGMGEEFGWRGLGLPLLQEKHSALTASVLLAAFWAIWHLPLFLYRPGYMHMGIAGIAGWAFSLLTGSILLTWFYNASGGSILVCAIFHATIDVAFTYPGLTGATISVMGILISVWGLAMACYLYMRNRKTTPP